MAKTILGIDIGSNSLKLALCKGGAVKKTAAVQMPANLVKDGWVTSAESVSELLQKTMKEHGIHAGQAAIVLPQESTYIRTVTVPVMTAEQLRLNIPYEFSDYIMDELKNYTFDYATLPQSQEDAEENRMELLAAAVSNDLLEEARSMLRAAGLKMVGAAPAECVYIPMIRRMEAAGREQSREYCFIDLGYQDIRMYLFHGEKHMATRLLGTGLSTLDSVIADSMGVDEHLAHTYFMTNFENVQTSESAVNVYGNITVELMRALNFYRFSNPDSQLSDVWLCGGGAVIEPMRAAIAESLDMNIHGAGELLPASSDPHSFLRAVGITMA